jgi:hypothetical protein
MLCRAGPRVRSFRRRSGSFDTPAAPGAIGPKLNARWEFYPISADVATAI